MGEAEKREAENKCAALAACANGVMAERMDEVGSGDRDFDLVFTDRPREPLEITTNIKPAARETTMRLEGNPFPLYGARAAWTVDVRRNDDENPIDVQRIAKEAPDAILALEAAGENRLDQGMAFDRSRPAVQAAARALIGLGVWLESSYVPSDGESFLWISVSSGGSVDSDSIAEAVEVAAGRRDNQGKLLSPADAIRRHLFVPPALAGGPAYMALLHVLEGNAPMPRVPVLPPPITTVWAASESGAIYVTPPGC